MRNPWCNDDLLAFFTAASVAQKDFAPAPADAAYCFAHTPSNEGSILEGALNLWTAKQTPIIGLHGAEPSDQVGGNAIGYSGYTAWRQWLLDRGVPESVIYRQERLARPGEISHSGTEAKQFVLDAAKEGWQTLFTVCHPSHALRGLTNVVTHVVRMNLPIKVYSMPGPAQPWYEPAVGSQGMEIKPRIEAFADELDRLDRTYNNEYDLVSCQGVLEYLEWRG